MTRYILIKRANNPWEQPESAVSLVEFKSALTSFHGVAWGVERHGLSVRNSDGSVAQLRPGEGLEFSEAAGIVHLVYEAHEGVVVHVDQNSSVTALAEVLAKKLRARCFPIPYPS